EAIDWVGQVAVRAALERLHSIFTGNERSRDLQNGNRCGAGILLNSLAYVISGDIRQMHVENDEVGESLSDLQSFDSARSRSTAKACFFQRTAENVAVL